MLYARGMAGDRDVAFVKRNQATRLACTSAVMLKLACSHAPIEVRYCHAHLGGLNKV